MELIGSEGLIVGGTNDEEAFEYLSRPEGRVANVRAALQELHTEAR